MGKIHAVSTQGLLLAVTLSLGAGFMLGQFVKAGKRTTFNTSTALKS